MLFLRLSTTCDAGFSSDGRPERTASDERYGGDGTQLWHIQTGLTGARGEAETCRICRHGACRSPAGCMCFQQRKTEGMGYL